MTTRVSRVLIVILVFLAMRSAASAVTPSSLDTWVDYCAVYKWHPKFNTLGDAECALIPSPAVLQRDPSTYDVLVEPRIRLRQEDYPPEIIRPAYCPNSKFYGEERAIGNFPGRTGLLVGPDLVLTAAHGILPGDTTVPWTIVFGFNRLPSAAGLPACNYNPFFGIPAHNVYHVTQIVAHGDTVANGIDLLLLRLDRPVVNRKPIRVRREGQAEPGDRLVAVGHPDQLTTKVDLYGRYEGLTNLDRTLLTSGIHSYIGSSGSMLYNWERDYVEGVISFPGAVIDVTTDQGCLLSQHVDNVSGIGHRMTSEFAAFIPPFSLTVSPLAAVSHFGPVGGPVSNNPTRYTISPPPGAAHTGPWYVSVEPPWSSESGRPVLRTVIHNSHLPGTFDLMVYVDVGGVQQGTYTSVVRVHDLTNGFVDTLRHTIEVGGTEFAVSPNEGINGFQMVGPIDLEKTYILRNILAAPVTVEVRTGSDWITLDGMEARAGGVLVRRYELGPAGSMGDTATVTAGVSRRIESGSLGDYQSTLVFDNLDESPIARGDTTLPVVFRWGRQIYHSERPDIGQFVPDGSPDGTELDLVVTDQFCLQKLEVSVAPFGPEETSELRITLISPDGTEVVVVDQEHFSAKTEPATFSTPAMEVFLSRPASGLWKLRVADVVPGGSQFRFIRWWLTATSQGPVPCSNAASDDVSNWRP